MFRKIIFLSVASVLLPLTTFAHGGHGHFHGWDLAHFLTSPLHAVPLMFAIGAGIFIYSRKKKSQRAKP